MDSFQVLVISHGKIAEKGTHHELVDKGGIYKKLVLRQLSAAAGTTSVNTKTDDISLLDEGEEDILISGFD